MQGLPLIGISRIWSRNIDNIFWS